MAANPTRATFDAYSLWVDLDDGRSIGTPIDWYPRLKNATEKQRLNHRISPMGIHWPDVDEDLSIAGMLAGHKPAAKAASETDLFGHYSPSDPVQAAMARGDAFAVSELGSTTDEVATFVTWRNAGLVAKSTLKVTSAPNEQAYILTKRGREHVGRSMVPGTPEIKLDGAHGRMARGIEFTAADIRDDEELARWRAAGLVYEARQLARWRAAGLVYEARPARADEAASFRLTARGRYLCDKAVKDDAQAARTQSKALPYVLVGEPTIDLADPDHVRMCSGTWFGYHDLEATEGEAKLDLWLETDLIKVKIRRPIGAFGLTHKGIAAALDAYAAAGQAPPPKLSAIADLTALRPRSGPDKATGRYRQASDALDALEARHHHSSGPHPTVSDEGSFEAAANFLGLLALHSEPHTVSCGIGQRGTALLTVERPGFRALVEFLPDGGATADVTDRDGKREIDLPQWTDLSVMPPELAALWGPTRPTTAPDVKSAVQDLIEIVWRRQNSGLIDRDVALDLVGMLEASGLAGEIDLLLGVETAARDMPRETPGPGGSSTLHPFEIEAAKVWANDRALGRLDAFRQGRDLVRNLKKGGSEEEQLPSPKGS